MRTIIPNKNQLIFISYLIIGFVVLMALAAISMRYLIILSGELYEALPKVFK